MRRATPADAAFLCDLFFAVERAQPAILALPPDLQETLLTQQYDARVQGFRQAWPEAFDLIIAQHGADVGRLLLACTPAQAHVVDIAILPDHQGQGIGSLVLRALCAEAQTRGGMVTLQAVAGGRAEALYQRLGFRVTGGEAPCVEMAWTSG